MKDSIVFFRTHYEAIESLMTAEQKADAYKTLFEYAFNDTERSDAEPLSKALLTMAKPIFDKQKEISKKRAKAGKKGGEASKRKQTKANESKSNQDKDKDKDKNKDIINTPYNPPKGGFESIVNSYTDDQLLRTELLEYVKMRKKLKKGFTEHALDLKLKKLDRMTNDLPMKVEIVKTATMNGWQDFYEVKQPVTGDWYNNRETTPVDSEMLSRALEIQNKRKGDKE